LLRPVSLRFPLYLSLVTATGCLVSFNDYPLGDIEAGSGGGGAQGGAAAAAGSPPTKAGAPHEAGGAASQLARGDLIDDFEDGNQELPAAEGRSGAWYVVNDGRGAQTPSVGQPLVPSDLAPARSTSARGVHTFGGPFETWGALIGTNLATRSNVRAAYDVSAFTGVRMWVRSGGPSAAPAARSVRLNLPTPATSPGGGCSACNDHFGAAIPLTAEWQQVEVPFASLQPLGFGSPSPASVDLTQVLALELLFARSLTFDLWVDDIELY
jgi:Carbohydrate binding domain (family 11)